MQNHNSKFKIITFSILISVFLLSTLYFLFSATQSFAANEEVIKAAQEAAKIPLSCANNPDAYPWCKTGETPGGFIATFYRIALGLVGGAALGVLIYGAILWTLSEAVSSKEEAKKWITGAIWGLALLLGAYLILYTINPDLVKIGKTQEFLDKLIRKVDVPKTLEEKFEAQFSGQELSDMVTETTGPNSRLTERASRAYLGDQFIVKNPCPEGQSENCVNLRYIRKAVLDEVITLRYNAYGVAGPIKISGGTECSNNIHASGENGHCDGSKIDVAPDSVIEQYIKDKNQSGFRDVGIRRDFDNAPLTKYENPKTGAIYVFEPEKKLPNGKIRGAHLDIQVKPKP